MWEILNELCSTNSNSIFQPIFLPLDFELEVHIFDEDVYPLVIIKACHFHISQAWYKQIILILVL